MKARQMKLPCFQKRVRNLGSGQDFSHPLACDRVLNDISVLPNSEISILLDQMNTNLEFGDSDWLDQNEVSEISDAMQVVDQEYLESTTYCE